MWRSADRVGRGFGTRRAGLHRLGGAISLLSRWQARLATRKNLLAAARQRHKWLHNAQTRAILAKRKAQVAYAHRVISRHLPHVDGVSNRGVALVAGFEGFRANVYRDVVGVPTQGYGETQGITPGRPWSRAYALARLRTRLNRNYLAPVLALCKLIGLVLTQNEQDALASLVYNLGPGILDAGHTMGDALRSKDRQRIADAFLVYDQAGGRRLPALTARRRTERALFLSR